MRAQTRFTPYFVSILLTLGFGLHLANLGQYVKNGHTSLSQIISPTMDAILGGWMSYCAVLLIGGAKAFFARFQASGWRTVVYWVVTFYVTVSVPGHVRYLATGDTRYFDLFPWWFSPLIMGVYVLFIAYFVTLRVRGVETAE